MMSDGTKIEWTDATWNPVTGCSVVSPGCTNCYAMRLAGTRLRHHPTREGLTVESKAGPVWNGQVRFNERQLLEPLRWSRSRLIFVCAHGDLFAEKVPDAWIDRVFAVMALCPQHTFQVLTKRPARMRAYLSAPSTKWRIRELACDLVLDRSLKVVLIAPGGAPALAPPGPRVFLDKWPLPNVWLGTSVEDQRRADERIPELLATPAAVRFISAEPLLGPIDLTDIAYQDGSVDAVRGDLWGGSGTGAFARGIDWVIVGGESGPGARPMHPDWARALRDQCAAAGVAFFFKQWGEWKEAGHDEDGPLVREVDIGTEEADAFKCIADYPGFLSSDGHFYRHERDIPEGKSARLMDRMGKKAAGRLLDGVEHNGMPAPSAPRSGEDADRFGGPE